ncbi:MAG: hypothetical protein ABI239_04590 [Aquihabitans sp.]
MSWRIHVAIAAVVGLVARIVIAVQIPPDDLRGDSFSFMLLGRFINDHGTEKVSAYYPMVPQAYYGLVARLGGLHGSAGDGIFGLAGPRIFALSGALPGVAGIVAVALLARYVGGRRAGIIAAWLTALSPAVILASPRVMSESLVVPIVAAALLAWYRWNDRPTLGRAAAVTGLFSLLVLTKAEGIVVLLVVVAIGLIGTWRQRSDGAVAPRMAGLGLVAVVPVALLLAWGSWSTANEGPGQIKEQGMSSFGVTALAGNCESAYRAGPLMAWKSYPCIGLGSDDNPEVIRWNESLRPRELLVENLKDAGPGQVVGVSTLKVLRANGLFLPAKTIDLQEFEQNWPAGGFDIQMAWWWGILAVSLGGIVVIHRTGTRLAPLLAPVVVANAAIFATWGNPRYRLLGEPSLVVVAACLLAALSAAVVRYQSPSASPSSGTSRSQRSMQSSQR